MLSTDREEFNSQVELLCQGYDVPTRERSEAYWKGCGKMSLIEFARCVEFALSEEGPPKVPNTHVMWEIYRKLKSVRAPTAAQIQHEEDSRDHLVYYANRLLLRHIISRGGLGSTGTFIPAHKDSLKDARGSDELQACIRAKDALVNWFTQPVREGDDMATPQLFIGQFIRTVAAVSAISPLALKEWQKQCNEPAARIPFPPWMARPLTPPEPLAGQQQLPIPPKAIQSAPLAQ